MAIPRYIEIHNEIRQRIAAGEWGTNKRLPAERDLAESFNVSRMTLRQAIQTLVDEEFWNAGLARELMLLKKGF